MREFSLTAKQHAAFAAVTIVLQPDTYRMTRRPSESRKDWRDIPEPAILLARLAVDVSIHGKGVGSALLKDALLRTAQAAETIGARAMAIIAE